ncbi:MAG: hypothetical protein ACPHYE_05280 [Henriciella sp.]
MTLILSAIFGLYFMRILSIIKSADTNWLKWLVSVKPDYVKRAGYLAS